MIWVNGSPDNMRQKGSEAAVSESDVLKLPQIIINYCSSVLMGYKPAALFTLQSQSAYTRLSALLPKYLSLMVLRKSKGRSLVLLFQKEKLEKTILNESASAILADMGYPESSSISTVLEYLKKQFENKEFPHEIGLFLGYPVEDVLGFVKHKGQNYKLCGYWKVYGDVEQAKLSFRQYDACRECIKTKMMNTTAEPGPLIR
jgi:hypothetical protein